MKRSSLSALVIAVLLCVSLIPACQSATERDIPDDIIPTKSDTATDQNNGADINSMDINDVDRLPDEMKDDPINKTLADLREFRRTHTTNSNGSQTKVAKRDDIPGQTKNRPDFSYDEFCAIYSSATDYVENVAKVPRRDYGFDIAQCIDPRMNALYDDEDKGVAAGYQNADIFVAEYETAKAAVYSYLVMVRDAKDGPWKVVYDGLNYKEK